jgi:hypothetical protein
MHRGRILGGQDKGSLHCFMTGLFDSLPRHESEDVGGKIIPSLRSGVIRSTERQATINTEMPIFHLLPAIVGLLRLTLRHGKEKQAQGTGDFLDAGYSTKVDDRYAISSDIRNAEDGFKIDSLTPCAKGCIVPFNVVSLRKGLEAPSSLSGRRCWWSLTPKPSSPALERFLVLDGVIGLVVDITKIPSPSFPDKDGGRCTE